MSLPCIHRCVRAGNNEMSDGRRQQQSTSSRYRVGGDRYRGGPSYDAYNTDAAHPHPGQSPQQYQQPQLWYPVTSTSNDPASPSTSSTPSSSSSSAAAADGGSRRALNEHDPQPPQRVRRRGIDADDGDDNDVRVFVAFSFVLELVVLVGLALLEYFLRSLVIACLLYLLNLSTFPVIGCSLLKVGCPLFIFYIHMSIVEYCTVDDFVDNFSHSRFLTWLKERQL